MYFITHYYLHAPGFAFMAVFVLTALCVMCLYLHICLLPFAFYFICIFTSVSGPYGVAQLF